MTCHIHPHTAERCPCPAAAGRAFDLAPNNVHTPGP